MSEENEVPSEPTEEDLKKSQSQLEADRFRAKKLLKDVPVTPLRMNFLIEQLVCDYQIIRQSWEAEKKGLEALNDSLTRTASEKNSLAIDRQAEIDRLKAENAEMKGQHKGLVEINKMLRQRPDLPVERIPVYEEMKSEIDTLTCALAAARECIKDIKCHDRECEGGQGCPEVIAEKFYNNPVGLRASEEMKGLRRVVEAAKDKDRRGYDYYTKIDEALEAYESRGKV